MLILKALHRLSPAESILMCYHLLIMISLQLSSLWYQDWDKITWSGDTTGCLICSEVMDTVSHVNISRQCIRRKIQCWLERQHLVRWQGLAGTFRQARELTSGPRIAAKTTLLSFNRAQSRVVIGLLTGQNTLRRHLHIMGLLDSPLCRKCGAGEETSAHVLCECEALGNTQAYLSGILFLGPWEH
jgi:hypothetical protein